MKVEKAEVDKEKGESIPFVWVCMYVCISIYNYSEKKTGTFMHFLK